MGNSPTEADKLQIVSFWRKHVNGPAGKTGVVGRDAYPHPVGHLFPPSAYKKSSRTSAGAGPYDEGSIVQVARPWLIPLMALE
jgi:hypothetical protein